MDPAPAPTALAGQPSALAERASAEPRAQAGQPPARLVRPRGLLRYPAARQLLRFSGVGLVCTAASLAIYALLRPWLDAQLANAAALILTSLLNTALNRRVTFRITDGRGLAADHAKGVAVIAVALVITGGSLGILHWLHPGATVGQELLTTTLAGFVATAVRFTLLRHWIFRRARHR